MVSPEISDADVPSARFADQGSLVKKRTADVTAPFAWDMYNLALFV